MTSRITFFALIGLILFSGSFVLASVGTSPVLMWSNTNFFSGKSIQEVNIVSAEEISAALRSESSSLSKYFNKDTANHDIIFVFVEPKLSSEQIPLLSHAHESNPNGGSLSNLKKFVENSASSVVFPYVTSSSVGDVIESALAKGAVHVFDATQEIQPQISSLLNNGVTDVFVVRFESPAIVSMMDDSAVASNYAADDATVASIIGAALDAPYIAIFTSNGADSKVLDSDTVAERHVRSNMDQFRQTNDQLYTTNWPLGIVEAIIVMSPFIAILFIGICCTMQIQSDLKFDAEKTILRKHL